MRSSACLSLLATLALACESMTVGGAPPRDPPVPSAEVHDDPGDTPCAELSREACRRSLVCTLAAPAGRAADRYICRPASGNCEVGLRQIDEDVDRCAQRTACGWREGACYCACRGAGRTAVPDGDELAACDCECSGGAPPGCAARD